MSREGCKYVYRVQTRQVWGHEGPAPLLEGVMSQLTLKDTRNFLC